MSTTPTPESTALVPFDPAQLERLDKTAQTFRGLVKADKGMPSQMIQQAYAVQQLRQMLTAEVMAPIMSLMSTRVGFLTDRDRIKEKDPKTGRQYYKKGPGYPVEIVKDVFIEALRNGAFMTGNEVNIISGSCYLTKEFCIRRLNDTLGPDNWRFVHGIIEPGRGGVKLQSKVHWKPKRGQWQEEDLVHLLKGDIANGQDFFAGKGDKKCGTWLLKRVTGEDVSLGDAEDVIDVQATRVNSGGAPAPGQTDDLLSGLNASGAGDGEPPLSASAGQDGPPDGGEGDGTPAGSDPPSINEITKALGVPRGVVLDFCNAYGRAPETQDTHVLSVRTNSLSDLTPEGRRELMARPEEWARAIQNWIDIKDAPAE